MVFKSYHNPVGLDCDIDDGPGETISIGSTKSIKEQKKKKENWKNTRQNKESNDTNKHTN
jgi:hypothetical protein